MSVKEDYEKEFKKTFDEITPQIKEAFENNEKMLELMQKCFLGGWRGFALSIKKNVTQ